MSGLALKSAKYQLLNNENLFKTFYMISTLGNGKVLLHNEIS